jgi:hypothetical protein
MRSAAHESLELSPAPKEGPFLRALRGIQEDGQVSLSRAGSLLRQFEPKLLDGLPKSKATRTALGRFSELEIVGKAENSAVRFKT